MQKQRNQQKVKLRDNLSRVKARLSCSTKLLAVSKTKPTSMIEDVYHLGQKDFGENKVQDLAQKSLELKHLDIHWHFIGHLQSNKINQLLKVNNLVSIHSVDNLSLLNKLMTKSEKLQLSKPIGVFLQINTSGETEKSGFRVNADLTEAIKLFNSASNLYLQGLMTIGKIRTESFNQDARQCFQSLLELKKKLDNTHSTTLELSMGMSQDFEIAQEYKSNWVRIGSDIFGIRD